VAEKIKGRQALYWFFPSQETIRKPECHLIFGLADQKDFAWQNLSLWLKDLSVRRKPLSVVAYPFPSVDTDMPRQQLLRPGLLKADFSLLKCFISIKL
jgi:hypothetical protein